MAPVFSTRFFGGAPAGTGAYAAVYTVPVGMVAVVRSIQTVEINAGFNFAIQIGGIGSIFFVTTTVALRYTNTDLRAVVNAGETIGHDQAVGGQVAMIISGYLLTT